MNSKTRVMCNLPLPYPEIRVERQNPNYAKMLSAAYAGQDGELTAILSYVYWHIVTQGKNPELLSDTLECISITEMRHLSMLGELIFLLGGDPRFVNAGKRTGVNTAMLPYYTDPSRIIASAIAGEDRAIKFYESLLHAIDDKYVREVLKRIIMDEEHHLKLFSEMQSMPVPYRR